ncbi:MAG: hypothetical protein CVU56_14940 [Deltaproteobacteria bacterium HGW-Deltaproteobacteria-14]|jgi:hypothetical protein|nr:MAG: hypothetical protein CVU56_14940 [Deltaproteobacteria bacterium HGW-Deltaproteobacteria-14]
MRTYHPWAAALLLTLGLALAGGCHDSANDRQDRDAVADTTGADGVVVADSGGEDTAVPADTVGLDTADTGDGASPDGSDTAVADTSTGPLPGEFGWPCSDNGQCDSGYCIEGYDGRVCSHTCEGGACEAGWSCRQDLAQFPDVVYVCVPSFPTLCLPCETNADCRTATDDAQRCVPRGPDGDDGAFCGGSCAGASCPPGYLCASQVDVAGALTPQCVPLAGACGCSPSAIASGASTVCATRNDLGRCEGRRQCTLEGLSECNAPAPALDRCDGVDDDCDGVTDEAHVPEPCQRTTAIGTCVGQYVCDGAAGARCDAPEPAPEACGDGVDNDCDGTTDGEGAVGCLAYWLDGDEDGFGAGASRCLCRPAGDWTAKKGGDCDDERPNVRPNALEVCDGLDNDCDDVVDDPGAAGCSAFFPDGDGDGFGAIDGGLCLCGPDEASGYTSKSPTDCDDDAAAVNPGAAETCDGVDNDCDSLTDEEGAGNCHLHFADADGDTWGDPSRFACRCGPSAAYPVDRSGDCDDGDADRNPGVAEACNGVDDDCDGATDELDAAGCTPYYRDSDGDDYGLSGDVQCLCGPSAPWDATVGGDCNDAVVAIHPSAVEQCNGKDDDCDGELDEAGAVGCSDYWLDGDLDSYGQAGDPLCLCAPTLPYVARNAEDCDDSSPFIHPNATEVCNQRDDDCDGATDEGVEATCTPFYYDEDGDNWGVASDSRCLCGPDGLYRAANAGDCDDTTATTHPFAQELCNGGVDDDCDGATDEQGASGCAVYYADADHDQVGTFGDQRCLCAPTEPWTAPVGGDCDESDAAVHPGADEVCNGVDDDCDGATDPAGSGLCDTYLRDSDQDGWGVAGDTLCLCIPTIPFTTVTPGDCNDADGQIKPSALEVCNGKDDDCSGVADDPGTTGCVTFYRDQDGDTWGDAESSQCLCSPSGLYTATSSGDCDDGRAAANPGVSEVCNGRDDDCDGGTDEAGAVGCEIRWRDEDGDGFGVAGDFRCLCEDDGGYRADAGGDCDDGATLVNPGALERCNGVDDDCNGATDEEGADGCDLWLRDLDGDGWGDDTELRCLCGASGAYDTQLGGDCNDSAPLISPESDEFCNGTDDDCDGAVDEVGAVGCQPHYTDVDGDGWGVGVGQCLCSAHGLLRATQATDCDDDDALRNPALPERCAGDGRDEDCDGVVDEANAEGCVDLYEDVDDDAFGVTLTKTCLCGPTGDFTATDGGDCDDDVAAVNPSELEVCNAVDDDCDGLWDEGCGMQVGGWPTAKYDLRRSGHGKTLAGPASNHLRWKRRLTTSLEITTSATVDPAGDVIIAVGDRLYKLRPSDGASVWETTMPAAMNGGASPTLRTGGTIVVPVGNGLALYGPGGQQLWHTAFAGAASEDITGAPLVDDSGTIYTVGYARAYAVDPGGNVLWSIDVPNLQYVPAHVGMSPTNGRIYFGCSNHALFAVEPSGIVAWTFIVANRDVDASVAISEDGVIFQSFGNYVHRVVDYGAYGDDVNISANANGDLDAHVSVWRSADGKDHVMTNANGGSGLKSFSGTDLGLEWTFAMTKDQSRNSTPIIDQNGVVYVGDDSGHFYAVNPNNTQRWRYDTGTTGIDSQAALVPGGVIFGDDAGWLYYLAP